MARWALAFLIYSLTAPLAICASDGWESFPVNCASDILPSWLPEIQKGRVWTKESVHNLAGLKEMTNVTCPAYMAKRNDSDAIREFSHKKAVTVDISPLVEREGRRLISFLESEYKAQYLAFYPAELDFGRTLCAQNIRQTRDRMRARLNEIQETAAVLAAKCFRANDELDQAALERSRVEYERRKPGAAPAKVSRAKRAVSDITGIQEDERKRDRK